MATVAWSVSMTGAACPSQVQNSQDRFAGEQAEGGQLALVLGAELQEAQRLAIREGAVQLVEEHGLALVEGLVGAALLALLGQSFQLALDRDQVVEQEFPQHGFGIALCVHAAGGMRHVIVRKGADDEQESVHLCELVQELARNSAFGCAAFEPGDIGIGYFCVNGLLRLEHLRESVHPGVGDIHHRRVDFDAARARGGRGIASRQRIEDGRLSGLRQSNDSEFHLDLAGSVGYT